MISGIRCIAWDFDGVLNDNVLDGRFLWQDGLEDRFGFDAALFEEFMFADGFWPIMRGQEDLLDRLNRFVAAHPGDYTGADILQFWFEHDARPCARMQAVMDRAAAAGLRQVIATNNETRRSAYIEREMGFGERVEAVFSSGRMKVAKPDRAYFEQVQQALNLAPEEILFVDDYADNIAGATACGWHVHHYDAREHDAFVRRISGLLAR